MKLNYSKWIILKHLHGWGYLSSVFNVYALTYELLAYVKLCMHLMLICI